MKILATLIGLLIALPVLAGPPILVDPQTGEYLGTLSNNKYDPDSISNPYGQYGSKYSPDSVNNPFGQYGSTYGSKSATNPYGNNAPIIVDPDTGRYLGHYSTNPYAPDSTSNPYGHYGSKYSPDSINNPYGQYGSLYSPDSVRNSFNFSEAPISAPTLTPAPVPTPSQSFSSGFMQAFGAISNLSQQAESLRLQREKLDLLERQDKLQQHQFEQRQKARQARANFIETRNATAIITNIQRIVSGKTLNGCISHTLVRLPGIAAACTPFDKGGAGIAITSRGFMPLRPGYMGTILLKSRVAIIGPAKGTKTHHKYPIQCRIGERVARYPVNGKVEAALVITLRDPGCIPKVWRRSSVNIMQFPLVHDLETAKSIYAMAMAEMRVDLIRQLIDGRPIKCGIRGEVMALGVSTSCTTDGKNVLVKLPGGFAGSNGMPQSAGILSSSYGGFLDVAKHEAVLVPVSGDGSGKVTCEVAEWVGNFTRDGKLRKGVRIAPKGACPSDAWGPNVANAAEFLNAPQPADLLANPSQEEN